MKDGTIRHVETDPPLACRFALHIEEEKCFFLLFTDSTKNVSLTISLDNKFVVIT